MRVLIRPRCYTAEGYRRNCDPHPALRATLSQWERDNLQIIPSPIGRGWREAPGEGRRTPKDPLLAFAIQMRHLLFRVSCARNVAGWNCILDALEFSRRELYLKGG